MPNMPLAPIEELEIRAALREWLEDWRRDRSIVVEEFRIERGASRIDLAAINNELVGYEIKSDRDTFVRFSNQIHAYNRVFDHINLVCGQLHAERAMSVIPAWWGIIVATREADNAVRLHVKRASTRNTKQSAFSLASLLWKDEEIAALASAEDVAAPLQNASAHTLWESVARHLSVGTIHSIVTESLLKRQNHNDLAVKTM